MQLITSNWFVLVIYLYGSTLFSQQYNYTQYTTKDGLPTNYVYGLVEDKEGYIWAYTEKGISKFNGYEFINFTTQEGLSGNDITDACVDDSNRIWLHIYNRLPPNYIYRDSIYQLCSDCSTSIIKLNDKKVGIEFENSTRYFHDNTYISLNKFALLDTFIFTNEAPYYQLDSTTVRQNEVIASNHTGCNAIFNDTDSTYYYSRISPEDCHICIPLPPDGYIWYYPNSKRLYWRKKNNYKKLVADFPKLINNFGYFKIPFQEKYIFTFNRKDLVLVDILNEEIKLITSNKESLKKINSVSVGQDYFIVSNKSGFEKFDFNGNRIDNLVLSDLSQKYTLLNSFQDSKGNIWTGSRDGGIFFISQEQQKIRQLSDIKFGDNVFEKIIPLNDSILLGFSDNMGVYLIENNHLKNVIPPNKQSVTGTIKKIHLGVFISSALNGFLVQNSSINGEQLYRLEKFIDENHVLRKREKHVNAILDVSYDRKTGSLYAGTGTDLTKYQNFNEHKNNTIVLNIPAESLSYNSTNELLYIGNKNGLFSYDGNIIFPITDTIKNISTLFQNTDNLWIGTKEQGLYCYDLNKKSLAKISNLSFVHSIKSYSEKWLIVACDEGIIFFDSAKEFNRYNIEDGLVTNETYDAHYDGNNLFVANSKGLWVYEDENLERRNPKRNFSLPLITKVSTYNRNNQGKEIVLHNKAYQNGIELTYNDNILNIEFSALNYSKPSSSIYSYKLEGFTNDWINIGTTRKVTFTNLNPGKYTLKVKAANEDNIWNVEPTKLDINITPPWYWSWWSKTIYILLTVGMIYWIYRFQLDRKLAENEIKRQKEVNHLRNRFYTNITHEFRTPLTVIQGMNAQIKTGQHQKETQLIQRNSQNLLNLVNQLLDLTKIESGQAQIHLQQGDIVPYLRYILESFHSLAAQKNISLAFNTTPSEIWMDYDADKIQHILSNLLSNAIKFTSENGTINLSIEQIERALKIQVLDNGIGIASSEIPYIFDRFYQIDTSNTRSQMGSGIGLALTKELVQLLEGNMSVESEVEKGTSFTISLPITNDAPIVEHNIAIEAQVAVSALQIEKQVTATNVLATNTAPLILLVEDNEDVLTYIIDCLDDNYQILTALDGEQGLKTAIEKVPDLIISDVMMPVMDGYTLCQKVQEQEQTNHIPTILLTARVDQESKLEGLAKGAVAYLAKPFDKTELRIRVEQTLARQKRLQVRYSQQSISEARPNDPFLAKVTALIEQDMTKSLNIDELSKALAMSSTQVYRKIKALTGKSTSIFVRHTRLKHAHHLLQSTDLSISEIAYRVGFKDPATFSRYFTEVFGIPPSKLKP